ncbi:transcriptional regulator [Staphylococcus succinus]|uniref:transcriptional regulator n=1 Tax=Staphylococcus succinus TaxID=61015 RepID=UPI002DB70FED|nr:transcriptional regulator [Staphylococcus succinus]MEB7462261.1 transcriptional regulator [Staphylococcus succinus]
MLDYRLNIYNNVTSPIYRLQTNHFFNIYLLLEGRMTLLRNMNFQQLTSGYLFYVYDSDAISVLSFEGTLLCLSINNYYVYNTSMNQSTTKKLLNTVDAAYLKSNFIDIIFSIINDSNIQTAKQLNMLNHIKVLYEMDPTSTDDNTLTLIKNVTAYINDNNQYQLTCQHIANTFFVQPSYLSREFSIMMHCTLSNYIIASKIYFSICDLLEGLLLETIWKKYQFQSYESYVYYFQAITGNIPNKKIFKLFKYENINALTLRQQQILKQIQVKL